MKKHSSRRILLSLVPVVVLMTLLGITVAVFGSDSMSGASQVALLFSTAVCCIIARFCFGTSWKSIEDAIGHSIGSIASIILLLLLIGILSGTWTMSGIVPTMIYYGLKIFSPEYFLPATTVICAIVSLMTGSSWTTIATIGIALLAIGKAEGFSDGLICGAIISGAYFGDKMSPMSDTTVMASSLNGVPIFSHIRYLTHTTVPTVVITLVAFTLLSLVHTPSQAADVEVFSTALTGKFQITGWLLVVPLLTFVMIYRRYPAIVVIAVSAVIAAVACLLIQRSVLLEIGTQTGGDISTARGLFIGMTRTFYDSVSLDTGVPEVDALVSSRGMVGMLNTIYLIICAMFFGASMRASGMIGHISRALLPLTKGRVGLVGTTVLSGIGLNVIVADQYLSIILNSNIFGDIYKERGYEGRLLSRSLEDSATVTSPLVPWNTCGMTQATILGVSTLTYLPFCFFNLLSPLVSILVAALGWGISKRNTPTQNA